MVKNIFAGKTEITEGEFIRLRNDIQELLWHYEFYQFDTDANECITGHEFAQSLIIYFPMKEFITYVNHLNQEEHHCLLHEKCSYHEFVAFQYFLKQRQLIIDEVMANGKIDEDGLRIIADEFTEKHEFM